MKTVRWHEPSVQIFSAGKEGALSLPLCLVHNAVDLLTNPFRIYVNSHCCTRTDPFSRLKEAFDRHPRAAVGEVLGDFRLNWIRFRSRDRFPLRRSFAALLRLVRAERSPVLRSNPILSCNGNRSGGDFLSSPGKTVGCKFSGHLCGSFLANFWHFRREPGRYPQVEREGGSRKLLCDKEFHHSFSLSFSGSMELAIWCLRLLGHLSA